MAYLLALPLIFAAGFLWTLGTDAANRIIIRRQRSAREAHRREVLEQLAAEVETAYAKRWTSSQAEVLYLADPREARWTAQ